ncbi:MAG: 4Fe-4S binding protein [bacterium]
MLVLEPALCTECGACVPVCHVDALRLSVGGLLVDQEACDGCKVCVVLCPTQALALAEKQREKV